MKVYSIERQKELHDLCGPLLKKMGYAPTLYFGDGYKGKEVFAPYQGIIVTCGAPFVPKALLSQLAIGGRLVIPVGEGDKQRMLTIDRVGESEFNKKDHGECRIRAYARSESPRLNQSAHITSSFSNYFGYAGCAIYNCRCVKFTITSVYYGVHRMAVTFFDELWIGSVFKHLVFIVNR